MRPHTLIIRVPALGPDITGIVGRRQTLEAHARVALRVLIRYLQNSSRVDQSGGGFSLRQDLLNKAAAAVVDAACENGETTTSPPAVAETPPTARDGTKEMRLNTLVSAIEATELASSTLSPIARNASTSEDSGAHHEPDASFASNTSADSHKVESASVVLASVVQTPSSQCLQARVLCSKSQDLMRPWFQCSADDNSPQLQRQASDDHEAPILIDPVCVAGHMTTIMNMPAMRRVPILRSRLEHPDVVDSARLWFKTTHPLSNPQLLAVDRVAMLVTAYCKERYRMTFVNDFLAGTATKMRRIVLNDIEKYTAFLPVSRMRDLVSFFRPSAALLWPEHVKRKPGNTPSDDNLTWVFNGDFFNQPATSFLLAHANLCAQSTGGQGFCTGLPSAEEVETCVSAVPTDAVRAIEWATREIRRSVCDLIVAHYEMAKLALREPCFVKDDTKEARRPPRACVLFILAAIVVSRRAVSAMKWHKGAYPALAESYVLAQM